MKSQFVAASMQGGTAEAATKQHQLRRFALLHIAGAILDFCAIAHIWGHCIFRIFGRDSRKPFLSGGTILGEYSQYVSPAWVVSLFLRWEMELLMCLDQWPLFWGETLGSEMGAILSAGTFVSAFVVGVVAMVAAPFSVKPVYFVRDVVFYTVAVALLFSLYISGIVHFWQALGAGMLLSLIRFGCYLYGSDTPSMAALQDIKFS
ncbi:hypothetical protein O6H91_Y451600 [Diphasiastrum complanatum]|nr:hypothetical protein O6H91_Y451600 [Diphasiastrum complanatum]